MTFRRRTYPEVLENMLTAITGGIAAEAHPFPPEGNGLQHGLLQAPVSDIISVYGSRDGQPHLFRKNTDYILLDDGRTLAWQPGQQHPDEGTLFQVNYYPASVAPPVNDLHVGSVTRTLAESAALEIASLYAQLEVVYQSGFIDTATGRALDHVVALLGIERVTGGRPVGEVEFVRSPNSRGLITIPAGTRIMTEDGNVEYETTQEVALPPGQNTVRVVARDLESNDPLPADSLIVLPIAIAGITSVSNPAPTALDTQDETDDELRTRAKNFLHGSERATLGAIQQAISRQGIKAEVTEDLVNKPGQVDVSLHAEAIPPELYQRILTAIDDAKPAGVKVNLNVSLPPSRIDMELRLTTAEGLLEEDLRGAQREIREKIADYFDRLPLKSEGSLNKIIGLVLSTAGVEDVRILSATVEGTDVLDPANGVLAIANMSTVLGDLAIADPNLPSLLTVTITFPETEAPPDQVMIQSELNTTIFTLNELNNSESAPEADRTISYAKLLHIISLPGKAGAPLETFNSAATPPDVAPYVVSFVIVMQSGLSQILDVSSTEPYILTPFERLSLSGVELEASGE